jgi:hypothetical protein
MEEDKLTCRCSGCCFVSAKLLAWRKENKPE